MRATKHPNPKSVAARFFATMARKRTNLIVAADVDTCKALVKLAHQLGPYICALKTHLA